eukprot:269109-Amphidinium_carterae.1
MMGFLVLPISEEPKTKGIVKDCWTSQDMGKGWKRKDRLSQPPGVLDNSCKVKQGVYLGAHSDCFEFWPMHMPQIMNVVLANGKNAS